MHTTLSLSSFSSLSLSLTLVIFATSVSDTYCYTDLPLSHPYNWLDELREERKINFCFCLHSNHLIQHGSLFIYLSLLLSLLFIVYTGASLQTFRYFTWVCPPQLIHLLKVKWASSQRKLQEGLPAEAININRVTSSLSKRERERQGGEKNTNATQMQEGAFRWRSAVLLTHSWSLKSMDTLNHLWVRYFLLLLSYILTF